MLKSIGGKKSSTYREVYSFKCRYLGEKRDIKSTVKVYTLSNLKGSNWNQSKNRKDITEKAVISEVEKTPSLSLLF